MTTPTIPPSTPPSRRAFTRRAAIGLAAAGLIGVTAGSASATTPDEPLETLKLNIGYIDTSINGVGVIAIANELDLWDEYALDVNLIPFTNGPTQIQAMQSGDIDVGYIGGGAVWLPASGQATVIVPSETSDGERIIVQPDAGVESMEDLAGMSVGVPEGGSGEMILALALDSEGMEPDAVERVYLDPPSIVTAFVSGQIDAAGIFSPLSDQILQAVPDAVVVAQNSDYPDTAFIGAWVASNDAITDKPEALVRFLQVYADANDYRVADSESTVELTSAESGVPAEQVAGQAAVSNWVYSDQILANNDDGTTFAQFESLEAVFVTIGRLDEVVPAEEFVNTELFAQAMEERG